MKCTKCNKTLPAEAKFCLYCGEPINRQVTCPHCSAVLPAEAAYCLHCGKAVSENVACNKAVSKKTEDAVSILELGDEFLIGLYESFFGQLNQLKAAYNESKNLHEMTQIFSQHALSSAFNKGVKEVQHFVKQSFGATLSESAAEQLAQSYQQWCQVIKEEIHPLLSEMDDLGNRIREELPATQLQSTLEGAVDGFIKGATLGVWGVAKAFIDGNSEDNKQKALLGEWDQHIASLTEQTGALWSLCLESIDELAEQCPVKFVIEDDALANYLEEKTGKNHELLPLLQQITEDCNSFYFAPDIPDEKLGEAKRAYAELDEDEIVLCLFDSTVFGGADDGALFTNKGVYWHEIFDEPKFVSYTDLESVSYDEAEGKINLHLHDGTWKQMDFAESENAYLYPMMQQIVEWLNS